MDSWDSKTLERCCSIIDNIRDSLPFYRIGFRKVGELSFTSGVDLSSDVIDFIKEYSHLEEYLGVVEEGIDEQFPASDLLLCNKIWSDIIKDKRISKGFACSDIKPLRVIDIKRYSRYRAISRLLSKAKKNNKKDEYTYWYAINNFNDDEHSQFYSQYLLFQQRLLRIIWGYISGNLKEAYANGGEALELYKAALSELFKVRDHDVFKFLHIDYFNNDTSILQANIKNIDDMKKYIVTTRNDDTLQERALAVELLKLFREFGNERIVSGVYNFMRADFINNDIDRKTIQRCFDALPCQYRTK